MNRSTFTDLCTVLLRIGGLAYALMSLVGAVTVLVVQSMVGVNHALSGAFSAWNYGLISMIPGIIAGAVVFWGARPLARHLCRDIAQERAVGGAQTP